MEEEAMETPARRSTDGQAHLEETKLSGVFYCDHCGKQFGKIGALNSHIRLFHRARDETTDEDSDAAIPYMELEEKPVDISTSHVISNQSATGIERTSIVKRDETAGCKLDEFAESKDFVSDLPTTLPGQQDNFQNVNCSATSNISEFSVKPEPEDFDKQPMFPPPEELTNVSAAQRVVSVVVKEEAPDVEIGAGQGPTDPPEGSCTKGKSAVNAGAVEKLTLGEKRNYLQARRKLYPFPNNEKDWKDLRIKFPDTCPYCPPKVLKASTQRGLLFKWRTHIKRHIADLKERNKAQAYSDLWDKHTACCLYCAREFSSKLSWSVHSKKCHSVSATPDKEFQVLFKAVFGLSSLDEEGDFESGSEAKYFWSQLWTKYGPKCPVCRKEYPRNQRCWTLHMLSHHTNNRIGCSRCNASFKTTKSAVKHEETQHNENGESFTTYCHTCDKTFTAPIQKVSDKRLRQHKRRMHPDPTVSCPFLCQTCGKGFLYRGQLTMHSRQHTDDRPFACEKCDNTYKGHSALRKHVQVVHEGHPRRKKAKSKLCSDCGEHFTPVQYKIHALSHTQEKPFKCSECDGAFTSKTSLTQHMVFHQGKRQYLCDICKSSFFLKHHLVAHMKTHTDEKPFHCDICSLDFRLKHHLQAHRTRRHGIQSGTTRGPKAKVITGLESKRSAESSS